MIKNIVHDPIILQTKSTAAAVDDIPVAHDITICAK